MEQADIKKDLRILMLEDTPSDAELAERELRKAGIAYVMKRVETRDAFVSAHKEFHPDIVLSDYKLPNFDGMSALQIVRRDYPEVPVIMATGVLSDIEAVELIHAGAKDYVLKDRLARLAPASSIRWRRSKESVRVRQRRRRCAKAKRNSAPWWNPPVIGYGKSMSRPFTPMPVRRCKTCWVIPLMSYRQDTV